MNHASRLPGLALKGLRANARLLWMVLGLVFRPDKVGFRASATYAFRMVPLLVLSMVLGVVTLPVFFITAASTRSRVGTT